MKKKYLIWVLIVGIVVMGTVTGLTYMKPADLAATSEENEYDSPLQKNNKNKDFLIWEKLSRAVSAQMPTFK